MGILSKFFGPPTQDQFARLVLRRLKHAGLPGDLQYDATEFWIRGPGGRQIYLGNAYAEYCRVDRSDRELLLRKYLSAWLAAGLEPPGDFEDVKADFFPVVRARTYYEVDLMRVDPTAEISRYPHQIIADHLCVSLVYDLPSSTMTVMQEQLEKWDVTLYEALEIANGNLRETTKNYAQIGRLYVMINGDSYDASRLVLTDLIGGLEFAGEPIAMVPRATA